MLQDNTLSDLQKAELLDRFKKTDSSESERFLKKHGVNFQLHLECLSKDSKFLKHPMLEKVRALSEINKRSVINEFIEALYIVGCGINDIIYHLYRAGYKQLEPWQIAEVLKLRKYRLNVLRKQFMADVTKVKQSVFQNFKDEVMEVEADTLKVMLHRMHEYQEKLLSTPAFIKRPVKDDDGDNVYDENGDQVFIEKPNPMIKSILEMIKSFQDQMNACHGIQEFRTAQVDLQAKIELARVNQELKDQGQQKRFEHMKQLEEIRKIGVVNPQQENNNALINHSSFIDA